MTSDEHQSKEQIVKLLEQISSNQNMQRGILEENLQLHDDVREAKQYLKKSETK